MKRAVEGSVSGRRAKRVVFGQSFGLTCISAAAVEFVLVTTLSETTCRRLMYWPNRKGWPKSFIASPKSAFSLSVSIAGLSQLRMLSRTSSEDSTVMVRAVLLRAKRSKVMSKAMSKRGWGGG